MIKIKNILFQKLFERTMPEIYDFSIEGIDSDNALETFELFYELEYKYNQLKNKQFKGLPTRKENILKRIESVAIRINEVLANSFLYVFEEWLSKHAILNPFQWATARYEDLIGENFEMRMVILYDEYQRYQGSEFFTITIRKIIEDIDNYPNLYKLLNFGANKFFQSELDDMGWNEFSTVYSSFLGEYNIKNKNNFQDFLINNNLPTDFLMAYADVFWTGITELSNSIKISSNYFGIYEGDVAIELYENLVFPLWFSYWTKQFNMEGQNIIETRDNIEELYQILKKINSLPIERQFMQINIATNITHQTGSMLDYYDEHFNVGKNDLEKLSNMNTTEWDEELKEIGVILERKLKESYTYYTDCTISTAEKINDMMDNAREISYNQFILAVSEYELSKMFPDYDWEEEGGLKLEDDYAVSYYRGEYENMSAYIMQHSGIEYVFVE